jgi:hypothetical protein
MMRICVTWDVLLVLLNPRKTLRLGGREHGRAIPLSDICTAANSIFIRCATSVGGMLQGQQSGRVDY